MLDAITVCDGEVELRQSQASSCKSPPGVRKVKDPLKKRRDRRVS